MEEIKTLQIEDTSFECQSLIQFSSLIKILYKLNEKEKSLEQKIDIINQTINEKEIRIKNLENKLEEQPKFDELKIGQSFISSPNATQHIIKSERYESSPKEINKQSNDIEEKKEKDKELNITLNEVKSEEKEKPEEINIKKEEKEIVEEIKDIKDFNQIKKEEKIYKNIETKKENEKIPNLDLKKEQKNESSGIDSSRNINPDLIKNLYKKSKEHEKRIIELNKKSTEHIDLSKNIKNNSELINNNSKKILELQKSIDDLLNKFSKHKSEFNDVKVKVQDFNVFDIIKSSGGSGSGNMDLSKALIMNLENKVFKKFELYDEHYKSYDTDIFKLKEDNKNINNNMNVIKSQQQKYDEEIKSNLKELNQNINDNINELNEQIIGLQTILDDLNNKNKENNDAMNDKINSTLKQSEEDIKSYIKNEIEQNNKNIVNNLSKEIINNNKSNIVDNDNLKNINKKIIEFQKKIISLEKTDNELKEKLQSIEDEIFKKFTRFETLFALNDKFSIIEEELNNESFKSNTIQQSHDKLRSDIANLVHKIEYINSEISKLTLQRISSSEKPEINIDFSKYLEKDLFINNKKEINNKFEKVRLAIENLGRNIESILTTLSHTVNQKEMSIFQNSVKSNFDEIKLNFNKKFVDKIDMNKNLKILETQIKSVVENNKRSEADNWLLAKKPLNNFLCASCESVIKGELDKRSDFIAWNKYPSRDDKNYRMGHGFSKMLQLVNDDIMRSTNNDNINQNMFTNTNNINTNSSNNTEDNNNIKTLFNIYTNSKLPKVKSKLMRTSRNNNEGTPLSSRYKNKDDHLTLALDEQKKLKKPEILKIYKINKNADNMNISQNKNNNSNSVNNIHKRIFFTSQKKIGDDNI